MKSWNARKQIPDTIEKHFGTKCITRQPVTDVTFGKESYFSGNQLQNDLIQNEYNITVRKYTL